MNTEAIPEPDASRIPWRRWTPLLRVLLTGALLWFVLTKVNFSELLALFARGVHRWPLLLLALALPALGLLIAAYRWQLLLKPQGFVLHLRRLYTAHLVGAFFNQFVPSTIGGDLARSWWVSRARGTPILNITVVGVDRFIGLVGICALASLAAVLVPSIAGEVWQVWLLFGLGGVLAAGAMTVGRRHARAAGRWVFSLPLLLTFRQRAVLIYRALATYRSSRGRLLVAVLLSMLIQGLVIIQYATLAVALSIDVAVWELAIVIPLVTLVTLVPVTINGLGLRENSLAALGAYVGLSAADAVALAWIVTAGTLCYAIIGGFIHAWGRNRKKL